MEFDWHDGKHLRNVQERGLGFDVACQIFAGEIVERIDDRRDYDEIRMQAIGATGTDIVFVVYTLRSDVRWIISARPANRKERALWLERHLTISSDQTPKPTG